MPLPPTPVPHNKAIAGADSTEKQYLAKARRDLAKFTPRAAEVLIRGLESENEIERRKAAAEVLDRTGIVAGATDPRLLNPPLVIINFNPNAIWQDGGVTRVTGPFGKPRKLLPGILALIQTTWGLTNYRAINTARTFSRLVRLGVNFEEIVKRFGRDVESTRKIYEGAMEAKKILEETAVPDFPAAVAALYQDPPPKVVEGEFKRVYDASGQERDERVYIEKHPDRDESGPAPEAGDSDSLQHTAPSERSPWGDFPGSE